MPALAAAIGPVAGLIGGSGFGALLTNALIGTAINFAIGAVIDWIEPDQPANDNARPTGVELQFRSGSKVAVSAIMGTKDTPGQLAYHNSYGPDNEFLQLLFIDGNGEHAGIYSLLFDNAAVSLSGSNADPHGFTIDKFTVDANNVEDPGGTPHAWVKFYTGAAGQAADPQLVARANPVGRWTSECTLTATAYRIVTLRYNPKLFGGAIPQMRAVWRGLKLYDRRKDSTQPGGSGPHRWGQPETYEWTENPAICQDNWRRGIWINGVRLLGLGVSEHDCYHAGIVAAANVSDEALHYADTDVTLPRYTLGIEVKDGTDPISMMRLFESAMAGYGAEYGGAYTPLPAQTMASVLTLTDRHRVAGEDVLEQTRMSPTETKTAFHGQFNNPAIGWLPDDYDIRFDAAAESQEGGRRAEPFDATFVWYRETASMLAEIKVRRDRYSALEVATFGPRAADLRPGQVITRESELLGTVQMMVLGVQRQPRKRYRLSLRSWNNAIVPTPGGGFMPLPPTPLAPPVPVRLTHPLAPLAVAISQVSGDNEVPAIRFTFTPITDRTVDRVIVKYWPTAHPTDVRYASSDEPGSGIMVIEGVAPVTEYRLVATIVTTPARPTTWTNEVWVTTTAYVLPSTTELTQEVKDARAWAARTIEQFMADNDAMIAHMADAALGGAVDQQILRTEITARFQSSEAEITAAYTSAVNVVASSLGALVTRTELLEATVNNPTTGVTATATALSLLATSVDAQFTAMASAITAVEVSVDGAFASGLFAAEVIATSTGASSTVGLSARASAGGVTAIPAIKLDARVDGGTLVSDIGLIAGRVYLVATDAAGAPKKALVIVEGDEVFIDTARIKDASILTAKIGNAQITNAKIADAAITNAKIGTAAITSAKIDDLAVGTIKLADGAVTSTLTAAASDGSAISGSPISLSMTFSSYTGGVVQIATQMYLPEKFLSGFGGWFKITLQRGSTVLREDVLEPTIYSYAGEEPLLRFTAGWQGFSYLDNPGSPGSVTYTVTISSNLSPSGVSYQSFKTIAAWSMK